ncbi:MAG: hypothetical protein JWO31_4254 [Phycisphaerales bacterium]|nr:hypothetical protein [Phycisphaerales bacterium]
MGLEKLPLEPDDNPAHQPQLGWKIRPWMWWAFWGLMGLSLLVKATGGYLF